MTVPPWTDPAASTRSRVADALTDRTTLVSVMAANNEVGTLQPIAEIGEIVRGHPARLHVDAVQFAAHAPIDDVNAWQATSSASPHTSSAAPGRRRAVRPPREPTCCRSSTAARRSAAPTRRNRERRRDRGLGAAFAIAGAAMPAEADRLRELSAQLGHGLLSVDGVSLTGHETERLANNVSVAIEGVEGGDLVAALDLDGVEVSTGSACTSGSTEPSHVLLAMGIEPELAHGSIRITTGPETTAEVDRAMEVLHAVLPRLRASREMVASA